MTVMYMIGHIIKFPVGSKHPHQPVLGCIRCLLNNSVCILSLNLYKGGLYNYGM